MFAAAAAAASASSAMASDLNTKAPLIYSKDPISSWQGFYVGATVGASWLNSRQDDSAVNIAGYYSSPGLNQTSNTIGFVGGLQAGYNFQDRNFVYGIEGDISWIGGAKATTSNNMPFAYYGVGSYGATKTSKVQALATLRARFGFDFDGTMPYLTAGVALGNIKNTYSLAYAGTDFFNASKTSWQPGLVVGAGIEHKFTNSKWTMKGEVLWIGFKQTKLDVPSFVYFAPASTVTFNNDMVIGRLGLNYRF